MLTAQARRVALAGLAVSCGVCWSLSARAERLPGKQLTVADGLPHNHVRSILKDSRGFLWFGTQAGLARFDGDQFTTYAEREGLPAASVQHVIETRAGEYWIATDVGVCRFVASVSRCQAYKVGDRPLRVNVLFEDRAGRLWAGTARDLFRLDSTAPNVDFARVPLENSAGRNVRAIAEDASGSLWLGSTNLDQLLPDGRVRQHRFTTDANTDGVRALTIDERGRLWIAHGTGLIVLMPSPAGTPATVRDVSATDAIDLPTAPGDARRFRRLAGADAQNATAMYHAASGPIWIATSRSGVVRFEGDRFHRMPAPPGITAFSPIALAADREGNLWAGTPTDGVVRMTREAFVTYDEGEGLPTDEVLSLFEDRSGALVVLTAAGVLHRFDAGRFTSVRPNLPGNFVGNVASSGQMALQDPTGDWWFRSPDALFRVSARRFDDLADAIPRARYTTRDGLEYNRFSRMRVFQDSRGDIWVGTLSEQGGRLARWDSKAGAFRQLRLARRTRAAPSAFGEDRDGRVWIGMAQGGMLRCSGDDCASIDMSPSRPAPIHGFYTDRSGRLWFASDRGGLGRIDDPAAARPTVVRYGVAQGLGSRVVNSVTGDQAGQIYVGTDRGIDRLDPVTGQVRHFTTADGLVQNEQRVAFRDRRGTLWFGSVRGLSSLVEQPNLPAPPPAVRISGLRIAGAAEPISALGETEIRAIELAPDRRQFEIAFASVGEMRRFQYRLDGADTDWSPARAERSVTYSGLPPGAYRFLVRAVNADGVVSSVPASVAFTVLAPVWRRWWFLSAGGGLLAGALYALHRNRVHQLLALERVRTRIASDLHDDIGSTLSQIAILGEVARARIGSVESALDEPLSRIGRLSRESVDSMSDIVWAIDPHKDRMQNLAQRMRRLASEVLEPRNIEFSFEAHEDRLTLGAEIRREVFLAFKEALNNVVRHSECRRVEIALRLEGPWLVLIVHDDGKGFDATGDIQGNGLRNLRRRAAALGGSMDLVSTGGTRITLRIPCRRRWFRRGAVAPPPDQVSGGSRSL